MKKLMIFVSTANQFLLFFAALLAIFLLGKVMVSELFKPAYEEPKVKIVDKTDAIEETKSVSYRTSLDEQILDVFVFNISSDTIEKRSGKNRKTLNMYSSFSAQSEYQIVNILFVPKSGAGYLLMQDDAYIRKTSYYNESKGKFERKLSKNLYLVASKDTNSDGFLGHEDAADLYVSDYNGKNRSVVLIGVKDYQLINDDLVMIEVGEKRGKTFFIYDVITKKLLELDTKTPLLRR